MQSGQCDNAPAASLLDWGCCCVKRCGGGGGLGFREHMTISSPASGWSCPQGGEGWSPELASEE